MTAERTRSTPASAASAAPTAALRAERIRRSLADAWGDMGAAWGVAPAIARVHGYLLSKQAPLTEREVREALGLSHRAASLALAESEAWGLVERVSEPRRVGRRGPAGVAYVAIGDHWRWFGRVVAQRMLREGDPVLAVLAAAVEDAERASAEHPTDAELAGLRDWLTSQRIGTEIYYPVPFHRQACFSGLAGLRQDAFPHADAAAATSLALPIYGELTFDQQKRVVDGVAAFYVQVR